MRQYLELEVLLFKWLRNNQVCSLDQIRRACTNLCISAGLEVGNPLYKIFFPLVRKGLIEFYGEGKYQVAQPLVLYYPNEKVGVGVNLTLKQSRIVESQFDIKNKDEFDIIYFEALPKSLKLFCELSHCMFSEPNVTDILCGFPTVSNIIEKFERASLTSKGEYYDTFKRLWSAENANKLGLFRIAQDGQKLYFRTENADYQIPDFRINPEGRLLAECYQVSQIENRELFKYRKKDKALVVNCLNIPILIDRALRLPSLPNMIVESTETNVYSNIPFSALRPLERIFCHKVKIEL